MAILSGCHPILIPHITPSWAQDDGSESPALGDPDDLEELASTCTPGSGVSTCGSPSETTVSASSQLERVVEQLRGLKVCKNSSPTPSPVPEDTLKSCGETVSSIGGKHGGHESLQPFVDLTVSDDETCTSSSTSRVDRVAEILKRARENKQKPKSVNNTQKEPVNPKSLPYDPALEKSANAYVLPHHVSFLKS